MAHAINAYQIRRVPGFASVPTGGLILLWACQPRIAWFDLFRLIIPRRLRGKKCFPKLVPTLGRELLLEIVALVYMGIAIHFADRHGYFRVKASDPAVPSDAKLLYAGATLTLPITILCLLLSGAALQGLMVDDKKAVENNRQAGDGMWVMVLIYGLLAGIIYMSTWLFWAGFIKLSGDL